VYDVNKSNWGIQLYSDNVAHFLATCFVLFSQVVSVELEVVSFEHEAKVTKAAINNTFFI